nr:hypothetical protein [uncultured Sphingomonas sp.]
MHRSLALCIALVLTTLSIATTGFAAEVGTIRFDLAETGKDQLQLNLRRDGAPNHSIGSTVAAGELSGLDRAALRSRDGVPISFALVREAGRLDCAGRTEARKGRGTCRFAGNAAFAAHLVAAGMARPSEKEWVTLTMVGARRTLVDALKAGGFAMPSASTLAGMTALGVSPAYIRDMAAHGYRPWQTADFIPLKALDVSPAYLRSLKSVGYDRLPVEDVIQLKALGITADFIASYQKRGFRNLSVGRLVQLKALGIRPEELGRRSDATSAALPMVSGASMVGSALLP